MTDGVVTPNIVAPTSGFASSAAGGVALTIPAIIAGGVRHDLRRDPVDASDVDDRVHHRDVDGADVGPRVSRGERWRPSASVRRPEVPASPLDERRVARAAESEDAVEASFAVQTRDDRSCAARHGLDRGPAVARRGELSDVDARRGGDLLPREVGLP